MTNLGIEK